MKMLAAAAVLILALPAQAQEPPALPDPATITLPDMSGSDGPLMPDDEKKHFYFHKDGVSFAEAYGDFAECYRFLPQGPGFSTDVSLPAFAPWHEPRRGTGRAPTTGNYGLVGAVVLGLIAGPLDRMARQARMRRCLEPRGYARYALREESWKRLIDDYSLESIALQAKAASSARPSGKAVSR